MPTVHRIEVRSREGNTDVRGAQALLEATSLGVDPLPDRIDCAAVYLVEGDLDDAAVDRLAHELLADPVTETASLGSTPVRGSALIEVHPQPGVMDPDAQAVERAVRAVLGVDARVRTGRRYDFHGASGEAARDLAERSLANGVIHDVHEAPFHPEHFPVAPPHPATTVDVPLRDLDDDALMRLSREAHLFLSLDEMRAIRDEYRTLERDPRDIELETLAQTWSEHCVHKTLKATIRFDGELPARPGGGERPGHELQDDGSVVINNLLKSTVAAATHELIADGADWCLSVFVDNAGIVAFDDEHAVCFKVETHNHPSAIEPYGGAATGIGGCIRDIIGTGLAAKPIAATDVFCVAPPDAFSRDGRPGTQTLPAGCLHPARILRQVVAGVRDYGNRMGIPTLNGAVWFDENYVGNPLVFCGCIGVMPRDRVDGDPAAGDRIIALGGRTGRDGIHGATFSSAELTDAHADEFSHAVQIGNAVTEKQVLDAILEMRDWQDASGQRTCLFRAITDCGAGGFSSAVGEMGEKLGACVELDEAPLKYDGLSPTEIWISEAQERMVLAVPAENVDALVSVCERHDVEWCDLGVFGTDEQDLILRFNGQEVGRLPMSFMHDGIPNVLREARWAPSSESDDSAPRRAAAMPIGDALLELLADPNIASKHWVIRQYDHEVQGGSVVKPLVGPRGEGPGDAAVITPVQGSAKALAIGNGLATGWSEDPYRMALAAIDECVRNIVCVGGDPSRIAILDNFCWPGCDDPDRLGALVLAAEGCYDGALAYRTPFISGKDSLNNQFSTDDGRTIRIPPTLLISGFATVEDQEQCVTMDAKAAGNVLVMVGCTTAAMGGSHYRSRIAPDGSGELPVVDLQVGPRNAAAVHAAVEAGVVRSAHDCSEGGLLVAAAEMCIGGGLGLTLDTIALPTDGELPLTTELFAETPSRYLLEVERGDLDRLSAALGDVPHAVIGSFSDRPIFTVGDGVVDVHIDDLRAAFRGTLDW